MLEFIVHAFIAACFLLFVDFTLQYGNIFDFYKKWIINQFYKGYPPSLLESDLYDYKESQINSKWYKVLGGCIYCFGFWLILPIAIYIGYLQFYLAFYSIVFVFTRILIRFVK